MSPFDLLLVGHLIGDFLLQTKWMALNKEKQWIPLFTHVSIYIFIIFLFGLLFDGLSLLSLALLFIGHVILDRRSFVVFWVKHIQMSSGFEKGWLSIVVDQIFHIILLTVAIYMTEAGI
jgi:hypothetical protein